MGSPEKINDYSICYDSEELGERMNQLELSIGVVNFENEYKKLVSPLGSKNQPFYSWGRYREAYSGGLVRDLIIKSGIDASNEFVLDPMCGSGSTLLASAEMGFDCLGLDVMQYSTLLSKSKFIQLNVDQIKFIHDLLDTHQQFFPEREKVEPTDGEASLRDYFNEKNFNGVLKIKHLFSNVDDKDVFMLMKTAWLSILEECSDKKKDGNGLATQKSRVDDCFSLFRTKLLQMVEDISQRDYPLVDSIVINESAANLSTVVKNVKSQKTLGSVIFSPPYANSFDYFESYKIELIMGGWYTLETLPEGRKRAIRSYRKGYRNGLLSSDNELISLLCDEINKRRLDKEKETEKKDNRSRLVPNLIVGYFSDMEDVLREIHRVLPVGKSCYIVVDQSSYLGSIVPTDILLAHIALNIGFVVEPIIYCRNSNTSPQQTKKFPYLKNMLRESIVHIKRM